PGVKIGVLLGDHALLLSLSSPAPPSPVQGLAGSDRPSPPAAPVTIAKRPGAVKTAVIGRFGRTSHSMRCLAQEGRCLNRQIIRYYNNVSICGLRPCRAAGA